jgi:hypothetical protein
MQRVGDETAQRLFEAHLVRLNHSAALALIDLGLVTKVILRNI